MTLAQGAEDESLSVERHTRDYSSIYRNDRKRRFDKIGLMFPPSMKVYRSCTIRAMSHQMNPTVKFGGGGIMVCECFSWMTTSRHVVRSTMDWYDSNKGNRLNWSAKSPDFNSIDILNKVTSTTDQHYQCTEQGHETTPLSMKEDIKDVYSVDNLGQRLPFLDEMSRFILL
ncbi:hypothetical protein TNCV_1005281, partial [Trichonephila clavipes]